MLFSSYIVIRTTSSWMRSCPITRFDTKKTNVKEWPSFESCSSPAPWGLLVFWILETVPHCDPRPKEAVHSHIHMHSLPCSPTVGSTACTYVLDSLHSPWDDALPHWWCPSLQQADCERSAASTIFSQRLACWTFKTGPKCSTSGEWDQYPATQAAKASFTAFLHHVRSQATKRTRRRTPWMSELSSRLLKSLLWESLPYP